MRSPRITVADIDEPVYWLGPDGKVWQLVLYCEHPTATFECLETQERRGGAVGSPILEGFVRLVPEESP